MDIKNVQKKYFCMGKRGLSVLLTAAMMVGMLPATSATVMAAEDEPYVVSKGRTVYASSSQPNSDAYLAVDGDESTRWESTWTNEEEWLYVDLGKVTEVTSVRLSWEGAYATSYKLQFSNDEENWTTQYENSNCKGGVETLNVTGNTRYVRIYMDKKALSAYGYSLYEFQVFGRNGLTERPVAYGENLAEGKSVKASSLRDVWWMYDENGVIDQTNVLAENAVDGKDNTYWTSGEQDNQWFYVDLGRSYTIGRVIIDWASDAGKIYDIQVSEDGNDWRSVYTTENGKGGEETVSFDVTTARYVKLQGITRALPYGYSLWDLAAYGK